MLPIEDLSGKKPNKPNKLNGGTFLGVRPETVSNEIKRAKTREQLRKNAEEAFKATNNSVVVNNAPQLISIPKAQNKKPTFGSMFTSGAITRGLNAVNTIAATPLVTSLIPTVNFNLPKSSKPSTQSYVGGQFSNIRQSINAFNKTYEPQNIRDYARNAAKADTAQTTDEYYFYNRRRVSNELHKAATEAGQLWMVDQQGYIDWILAGTTPEEQQRREALGKSYFEQYLRPVSTFDPSTNSYAEQMQFKEDTPLPPWVQPTRYNNQLWQYYVTYSHDVVAAGAQAYNDARDKGREYVRNPYKSAFSESETPGQINSLLDILIASYDKRGFDATYEKLLKNTTSYVRDYVWNPLKAGPSHWGTAAGNAIWNLMETMDVASRGVRAFVAGETALGGVGGRKFINANSKIEEFYNKNWEK